MLEPREPRKTLNTITPGDVFVREVAPVPETFDAHRSATPLVYEYHIWNQP